MAERATIARPYAKAAFEYARDAKSFAEWSAGRGWWDDAVGENERLLFGAV